MPGGLADWIVVRNRRIFNVSPFRHPPHASHFCIPPSSPTLLPPHTMHPFQLVAYHPRQPNQDSLGEACWGFVFLFFLCVCGLSLCGWMCNNPPFSIRLLKPTFYSFPCRKSAVENVPCVASQLVARKSFSSFS